MNKLFSIEILSSSRIVRSLCNSCINYANSRLVSHYPTLLFLPHPFLYDLRIIHICITMVVLVSFLTTLCILLLPIP